MNKHRIIVSLVFLLAISLFCQIVEAQQNVVDIYRHNQGKMSFLKSEIDSITFERQSSGSNFDQIIWKGETTYRMSLSPDDIVSFSQRVSPYLYNLTEGIDTWSRIFISSDGSLLAIKDREGEEQAPEQIAFFVPDSTENKSNLVFISFQDDGALKSVYVNGNLMTVRRIYDGMMDVTVMLADTLTFSCDSVPLPIETTEARVITRRSWTQNNIWRNVSAVGKILAGATEFIAGGVGATLSLPAGFVGGIGAAFGLKAMYDGLNKGLEGLKMLNGSDAADPIDLNRVAEDVFENFVGCLTGELGERFKKVEKPSNVISALADLLNLSMDYLDEKYGYTLTLEDLENNYYEGLISIGYKLMDKAVIVKGYVAQENTKTMYGTSINYSYGFVLYDSSNSSNFQSVSFENKGGGHFEHEFRGLAPGTTYCYRIFYKDNDNHVTAWSEPESFTMPLATTGDATPVVSSERLNYIITGSVKGMSSAKSGAYVYVVYSSESDDPKLGVHQDVSVKIEKDGDFSIELSNLDTHKTYHYKTCLLIDDEEFYGESKMFGLNEPMGLTYEKKEEFSTSDGIVYVNYEVKTNFRPNELQSAIGVILYQDGEVISRNPMKMVEPGNERDIYSGNLVLGVERTDFELDYANHRATTKNLYLALCVNMEINGKVVGAVFDKIPFTILYDQNPDIVFTSASVTDIDKYTDDDGNKIAVSTYSYDVTITGAFWMTNAIFKSKGNRWEGNLSDIPFWMLSDNELPGNPGLLSVVNYNYVNSSDLKLSSYFDIILANGSIKKSSNHLEWKNNGHYITGVSIVSGGIGNARMKTSQNILRSKNEPIFVMKDGSLSSIKDSIELPEQWRGTPTLNMLRNKQ